MTKTVTMQLDMRDLAALIEHYDNEQIMYARAGMDSMMLAATRKVQAFTLLKGQLELLSAPRGRHHTTL